MDEQFEVLINEEKVQEKVGELAEQISRDYAGKELLLVCILKGAAIFTADLARRLTVPVEIEFAGVSSYGDCTTSSGTVSQVADVRRDIRGRHVLLVDGIVDSGRTLASLLDRYAKRLPASLRVAVLLDKPQRRVTPVQIDYRGFEIPDRFVVGYGMDMAQKYRNLPYIAVVAP